MLVAEIGALDLFILTDVGWRARGDNAAIDQDRDAIGKRERIKPWVDDALSRGERLMGFGHRVYRVRDPRADVLKVAVERLSAEGADLPFAGEVEAYIREALRRKNPNRPLETNVEFFTAILLDALAIPRQAFTPIFAKSACSISAPAFGFGFSTLPFGRTQIVVSKPFG